MICRKSYTKSLCSTDWKWNGKDRTDKSLYLRADAKLLTFRSAATLPSTFTLPANIRTMLAILLLILLFLRRTQKRKINWVKSFKIRNGAWTTKCVLVSKTLRQRDWHWQRLEKQCVTFKHSASGYFCSVVAMVNWWWTKRRDSKLVFGRVFGLYLTHACFDGCSFIWCAISYSEGWVREKYLYKNEIYVALFGSRLQLLIKEADVESLNRFLLILLLSWIVSDWFDKTMAH